MKLTMLGGGGFRTPLVYGALLTDTHDRRVSEVWLHDVDESRLRAIQRALEEMSARAPQAPTVHATTDLDRALEGADFVFSAIRTGGLEGRTQDERVALELGLLGQETTGPGGIAYGLRTVPVARHVAERVRVVAPDSWVINFTNPAGMITEAMQAILGGRVVGICDSPIALARRAIRLVGATEAQTRIDYVGLNHLGWLRGLEVGGQDALPGLMADAQRLAATEEGQLFGTEWLQTLGMIPNEYLYYYYFTRDAVAGILAAQETRGEYLLRQQAGFYATVAAAETGPLAEWDRVRLERNATYMREARAEGEERGEEEVQGGGYEGVALAIMAAISRGEPAELILNVRNAGTIPGLPDDAVVEVPCTVDAGGPRPHRLAPLTGHPLGLVQQVKAVDRLVIEAAVSGDERLATQAFALHPLVDSVTVARELLAGYRARIPLVDKVFQR
ncbi:MAG: 6-phospho-beta-glucosidase [Micrococcales bacterium]|nr:6-phospho-beta-glucosidase [Micrococcales bacterium]